MCKFILDCIKFFNPDNLTAFELNFYSFYKSYLSLKKLNKTYHHLVDSVNDVVHFLSSYVAVVVDIIKSESP